MYINFNKIRFSCYALGKIMGLDREEKLSKEELRHLEQLQRQQTELTEVEQEYLKSLRLQYHIANGSLSKTCLTYLREEIFIYHKYGKRIRPGSESFDESNTRIIKGSLAEYKAVELLSKYDGIKYHKNKNKYRNRWISGIPDINYKKRFGDRKVIDIKTSWDMYSFMANIPKNVSLLNKCQIQGYISLTNADIGEVCHVLVSAPEELIEKQVNRLRYKNVFATHDEFEEAAYLTRKSMRFDDIPMKYRVIRFPVERSEKDQQVLFERVDLCREYLMRYQEQHSYYFKKP